MLYMFAFVFLTSFSAVLRHTIGVEVSGSLMIFLSTCYAIIFFHMVNYKSIFKMYAIILANKWLYILTCSLIMTFWIGSFLVPVYYTPTIQVLSFLSLQSFFGSFFLFKKVPNKYNLFRFLLITIALIGFYIICFNNYSLKLFILLLIWTVLNGTTGYIYVVSSWKLSKAGLSASEILATRFWLLLIVTGVTTLYTQSYHQITLISLRDTFFLSVISMIIPVYCSQKAINILAPELYGVFAGISPFITYLMSIGKINSSLQFGYISIVVAIAIILPFIIQKLKKVSNA